MFKEIIICFLLFFLLSSCRDSESKRLSAKDTSEIIAAVLNNRSFLKENINHPSETIYFLKEKYYNNSWPSASTYFKIVYIEDTEAAKIVNRVRKSDQRIRIGVPVFNLKRDTVSIVLYDFGLQMGFIYKLVPDQQHWKIVKESIGME